MAVESTYIKEHLLTLIKRIAAEQKLTTTDTTITVVLVSSAEDYPQIKFKIKIAHEDSDDLDLFAKVTELGNSNWKSHILKPYEKERLFYTTLMKIYKQLEDKHGVPEKDRIKLPACYGAEAAHGREILILEDLTSRGFGLANRFESVSWPYAAAAITELAKFHALSMAFKHENPSEFEKITSQLPGGLFEKNEETDSLLESFKSFALNAVRNENRKKLKVFLDSHDLTSFNDMLKPFNHTVILHAHFWPKNMMHNVLNDDAVQVIPVDYQTIQAGSSVTDLFHFIFTATDASFRIKHSEELIRHYFSQSIDAAARLGLDIKNEYSKEVLEPEMSEKLSFGLLAAVAYLPVLALDDRADRAQQIGDGEDQSFSAAEFYIRRLNEVVDAYVNVGILKENPSTTTSKCCGMCFLC